MADVQLENGYIKIATEIYEALAKIRINGEARQVLDVIIRKTYGWQKKEDKISLSQFNLSTGIHIPNICKAIVKLTSMNLIIITQKENENINLYKLNKDFDTWKPLPKKRTILQKENEHSPKRELAFSKKRDTIDTITKDTITINTFSSTSDEVRLSELLLFLIVKRNANHKIPNLQTWAKEIDKMIRVDKRTIEEIETVIKWCQTDSFWQNNILSTKKLREKFDQLKLKSQTQTQGGGEDDENDNERFNFQKGDEET